MKVHRLTQASQQAVDDINGLLAQMRDGEPSVGNLQELEYLIDSPDTVIVVAEDAGHVVGLGMAYVWKKVGKQKAFVEDVVVNEGARGKGLGTQIMQQLIEFARAKGAKSVVLTSNNDRKAAHGLYKKLGFEIRDTSYFRLKL